MNINCQNNGYAHKTSLVLAGSSFTFDWMVTSHFRARCNWVPASPEIADTGLSSVFPALNISQNIDGNLYRALFNWHAVQILSNDTEDFFFFFFKISHTKHIYVLHYG